jgi:hypothetical protein
MVPRQRLALLHAVKESWNIPSDTKMTIEIQFDRDTPYTGNGFGKGTLVEATVQENIRDFMAEFRDANHMYIRFPDGNEGYWTADMTGSEAIAGVFAKCIKSVGSATQPHAKAKPKATQPHSGKSHTSPSGNNKSGEPI